MPQICRRTVSYSSPPSKKDQSLSWNEGGSYVMLTTRLCSMVLDRTYQLRHLTRVVSRGSSSTTGSIGGRPSCRSTTTIIKQVCLLPTDRNCSEYIFNVVSDEAPTYSPALFAIGAPGGSRQRRHNGVGYIFRWALRKNLVRTGD